jgi:predicted PurR-regulated permease PerM
LSVLLVIQALQDMVIVPKVMGQASGLSPAVMLLSLTVWGQLLGFFGLILAIPITCLSLVWYHRFFFQDEKPEASL